MANTIISEEKMIKKYRFLTNTTESAKKKMLPQKEVLCTVCNKEVTDTDLAMNNVGCTVKGDEWRFFHKDCYKNCFKE